MEEENTPTTAVHEDETSEAVQTSPVPVLKQLSVALGILVCMFGVTYMGDAIAQFSGDGAEAEDVVDSDVEVSEQSAPDTSSETEITYTDPFETVVLTARSAYVWDVTNQRALYTKNPDLQWPLASVTKLMTALVAYELLEQDVPVEVSHAAVKQAGDSGLYGGEQFSRNELMDFVLLTSSNDGAYALAAAAGGTLFSGEGDAETFIDAMNIRAEEIGLSQTFFRNPTGLDEAEDMGGAYGSARDVAFLMEYIVANHPHILEGTRKDQIIVENLIGETHFAENTNQFVTDIEGVLASKTGYTELAGGNLVIAFDAGLNHPVIISVLGSTYAGRFADVLALTAAAKSAVAQAK